MVKALLPFMPFPSIAWWAAAAGEAQIGLDAAEHYRKMSGHNRYRITAANGPLLLTVPLAGGRDQRSPVGELRIDYTQDWPKQHWRTLFSAYGRAPYFDHYAPPLQHLLQSGDEKLTDLCSATITWMARELGWKIAFERLTAFQPVWPPDVADYRFRRLDQPGVPFFPRYLQVFDERNGFAPNLSLLDLLMNEGPAAASWLRAHGAAITASVSECH